MKEKQQRNTEMLRSLIIALPINKFRLNKIIKRRVHLCGYQLYH